jgi:CRP/FNR family transcriptional regulator, cyclic AMP receptor protein
MGTHPHFLWADLFRRGKSTQRKVAQILKENILFCTLIPRELSYLSSLVYERVYQPDEPIFQQNDRGIGVYVITKGRVAIQSHTPQAEVLVTILHEGSFFGEIALVDPDNVRTASAIALERSIIIGFFKPDLSEILERKPAMGVKILFQLATVLGHRLIETTEKITQMTRNLQENNPDENPHGTPVQKRSS